VQSDIDANAYPYVHLVRGALLEESGQKDAAIVELEEAARRARNPHERRQILERVSRLTMKEADA
jgi:predicted RNA polymerase sigma factor